MRSQAGCVIHLRAMHRIGMIMNMKIIFPTNIQRLVCTAGIQNHKIIRDFKQWRENVP